jgi:hypothetical protein
VLLSSALLTRLPARRPGAARGSPTVPRNERNAAGALLPLNSGLGGGRIPAPVTHLPASPSQLLPAGGRPRGCAIAPAADAAGAAAAAFLFFAAGFAGCAAPVTHLPASLSQLSPSGGLPRGCGIAPTTDADAAAAAAGAAAAF